MSWIITIPKTIKWEDYVLEMIKVGHGKEQMYYRMPFKPKDMLLGDRCYVVWNGRVRGWMSITGFGYREKFTCSTTGTKWKAGFYVARSGDFHSVDGPEYKGFQGIRKYQHE